MTATKALALALAAISVRCGNGEIVDLTHDMDEDAVFWPGSPTFKFDILKRQQVGSHWYETNNFSTPEHGGTHLDSPSHFYKDRWRTHQVPLRNLIGPGVVIDISSRAKENPDAQVEISDIQKWEAEHGQLPERAIVLMNSGWGNKWPNKTAVFGTEMVNDSSYFHFPGFNPSTAQWLIDNRGSINGIGVDTPSNDFGQSTEFRTHVIMAEVNKIGLENVANLDKIPVSGSTVYAIPVKLKDGSGGPARIFAVYDEATCVQIKADCTNTNGALRTVVATLLISTFTLCSILFA